MFQCILPLLWAMCLLRLHPLFFLSFFLYIFFSRLHCSRLWVNGGVELHSEAGWIVNELKRCHMQSAVWPPGGRHGILKCSIVTHYRCFFFIFKADKNSCVKSTTNPFLLKLVIIGIYFGTFMQILYSPSSKRNYFVWCSCCPI